MEPCYASVPRQSCRRPLAGTHLGRPDTGPLPCGPSASRSPSVHRAFELLEQPVASDLQLGRPIDPGAKVVGNGRHGNGVDAEASSSVPPLAETHA